MKIIVIIMNGRHGGQIFTTEYMPIVRLPVESEAQISWGEKYDKSVRIGDYIEYKECFRSVDKHCVLYSEEGRSEEIKYALPIEFRKTYPVNLF